jgi:hypothetical protein
MTRSNHLPALRATLIGALLHACLVCTPDARAQDPSPSSSQLPSATFDSMQDSQVPAAPERHEPSSMTLIQDWDGHSQGAWRTADGKPIKQTFALDSEFNDTVMVQTYGPWEVPPGQTWGPGHLYYRIPAKARPLASFYLQAELKLSDNWRQPPGVGDLKLFQMFPASGRAYNVGIILLGREGHLRLTAYENNSKDRRYNGIPLGQNPPGSRFVRPAPDVFTLGTWHIIEVLVLGSPPGSETGRIKVWLDGRLQIDVRDMMWSAAGEDGSFSQFDLNSLWGGQGGSLSSPQYMYVGRIHLSGSLPENVESDR